MTDSFARDMIDALSDALDHAKGKATDTREHRVEVSEVCEMRDTRLEPRSYSRINKPLEPDPKLS